MHRCGGRCRARRRLGPRREKALSHGLVSWDIEPHVQLTVARPSVLPMNQLLRRAAAPAVLFLSLVPLHAQSWRVDVDVPFASGQAVFTERGAQGYWMSGVTMRAAPNGDLVLQMLWSSPAPSGGWVAHGGMDSAGYQQLVNQYAQSNIYPVMVDAAGEYPNEHYIAVWRDRKSVV